MERGNFIINIVRWGDAGFPATIEKYYDCCDCTKEQKEHEIVREQKTDGPYPDSHYRKCTGCGKKDGPWIDA